MLKIRARRPARGAGMNRPVRAREPERSLGGAFDRSTAPLMVKLDRLTFPVRACTVARDWYVNHLGLKVEFEFRTTGLPRSRTATVLPFSRRRTLD
jgi:hypothetical protein